MYKLVWAEGKMTEKLPTISDIRQQVHTSSHTLVTPIIQGPNVIEDSSTRPQALSEPNSIQGKATLCKQLLDLAMSRWE